MYEKMLEEVAQRIWMIEELSKEEQRFNDEWRSLNIIQNELWKLIKGKQDDK